MAVSKSHEAGIFVQHTNFSSIEDQANSVRNSQWAYVNLHSIGSPDLTDDGQVNRGFRDALSLYGMMKIARDVKRGGGFPEHDCNNNNKSKEGHLISRRRPWDSCVNVPNSFFRSPRTSPPSRVTGGHDICTCSVSSSSSKPQYCSSSPPPVESCMPGLHQKYHDFYPDCKEFHLPECYRRIVEHDDLYLPPSRPLSPALTDHDWPLSRPCSPPFPRPATDYSSATVCPRPPAVICSCPKLNPPSPPSASYRDVYLPDTRPCTPKAEPPCPCPSPRQECFDLAMLTTVYDNMPVPRRRKKSLDDPYLPKPRNTACSTSPSRSSSPCCEPSTIMSRPKAQLQSRVCQECHSQCCKGPSYCNPQYIVETPLSMSPPHSKVPSPRSRNQGRGGGDGGGGGRGGGGGGGGGDLGSPRCQACDCHKKDRQNGNSFQSAQICPPPKTTRPCYSPPASPCPPSPSPPSPCAPPSPCGPPPCRLLLAAEMLSSVEECAKIPSPKCAALFSIVPCPKPSSRPASPRPASPPSTCPPKVDFCKTPRTPSPEPKSCNTNTECANCDCHKPAANPPTPRPCGCPVPAWKLNLPPPSPPCKEVEAPRSPSLKTAEPKCDCHVTKKHKQLKFSNQITTPSLCPSPECEDCDCNRYQRKKIQDLPSSKTTPPKQRPAYSPPLSPALLSTDDGTEAEDVPIPSKSAGKSPKRGTPLPRLRTAETWRAFECSKSPDRRKPLYSSEDQPISKASPPRKKSPPPRPYSKRLPPSRVPRPSYTQGITRRCCCGGCECLDASSMISTKCPFCSHVHSCCCGMCNCPIPTCSSKSPISDSSTPTPRSPQTMASRLPFRSNSEFYSSSRLKSPPPLSARSYFNNRPATQVKSKSRLELLDPVHHPSPRSQIELFNKFLKSQSSRYAQSPPQTSSAQKEFLPRRSQAPESARTWRSYKQQHQQHHHHHQGRSSHVPKGASAILLPTNPSHVKVCLAKTSQPNAYENLRSMQETRLLSKPSLGRRGGCTCRSCAYGETPL